MLNFGQKDIYRLTYIYLSLPLFLFLAFWMDCTWSILFTTLFGIAFYRSRQDIHTDDTQTVITGKFFGIIGGLALIWCFLAGIGYFYYQSFDYHFRNAVFRDLISYPWPVFYPKAETPLVYYMGFWLPSAFIGKLFMWLCDDLSAVFLTANILLYLYAAFGVCLIFAHLIFACKTPNTKQLWLICLIFIFFSGMDIIGIKIHQPKYFPFEYHLEWWIGQIQYSGITTSLFWVFNQFIPIALITLLLFNEKNIKNFGLLIALALFSSPYPTLSLGIFMVVYALTQFLKNPAKLMFIKQEILTLQNCLCIFLILPIIILYFITNSGGIIKLYSLDSYITPSAYVLFILCEFVGFALILYKHNSQNVFYLCSCVLLFLIPLIKLDAHNNFCMRASIPPLVILATLCARYAQNLLSEHKISFSAIVFTVLILFGLATPITEFYRGIHYTSQAHRLNLVKDDIYTLNQTHVIMPKFRFVANYQFSAQNYKTDIFWNIFAKKSLTKYRP